MKEDNTEETKKEDNEEMTFRPLKTKHISENIKMFQQLSQGTECVLGSGCCSSHNIKLVRSVKKKKVINIDDCGKVTLTLREVTSLACPANPTFKCRSEELPVMSQRPNSVVTNGKRLIIFEDDNNQSPVRTNVEKVITDRLLDGP